jgi:DNA polymerase-4
MTRKILHLDLDAFFCAVEELHNPSLKGKPFAVGGRADQRGVVASCSYAARMKGVRSAMPMGRAQQLCPDLIVISSRHGNYGEMSRKVMALVEISPLIEQISIDEAFIDISDLQEPLIDIAKRLQTRINNELNLPVSFGGATNKLIAKIANDWGKSKKISTDPPNTITVIPPGEEAEFLAPLPVDSLWGIGSKTTERLARVGIRTIGHLADAPATTLEMLFGDYYPSIRRRALGIDNRPVTTEHEVKSISNEVTFAKDKVEEKDLRQTLRYLSEKVGKRLRKQDLGGSTIQIKLRWSDFTTITRQTTLPSRINMDQEIFQTALTLFHDHWPRGKPVRLLGVGVSNLGPPMHQLSLWDDNYEKKANLLIALDGLRERYGKDIIMRANQFHNANPEEEDSEDSDVG